MARHISIPKKELDAKLKRKRKVSASTRARINEITENPTKRATLMEQAGVLEEIIETLRVQVLKGIDSAARNTMKAQKQLADLLQNKAPDRPAAGGKAGLANAPRWVPEAKPVKKPDAPAQDATEFDDADLNEQLAVAVAEHAVKN